MEKAELIKKWLDNNLSKEEQIAFEALDDYDHLIKLNDNLKRFKAPTYESENVLNTIFDDKKPKKNTLKTLTFLSKIAAVFVLGFSIYYFSLNNKTNINTLTSEKISSKLPDNSLVTINAMSSISFNKKNWNSKRNVKLKGEAYFKVSKGSKFNVITKNGIVSVLGTEFNVKNRDNTFEVICYEGSVKVTHKNVVKKLLPGDYFKAGLVLKNKIKNTAPTWIKNESTFYSQPFIEVIQEFERQYNVKIKTEKIDTTLLFTGKFIHNDIDIALKTLTLPFNIIFEQNDNIITLKSEDSN